LGKLNRFTFVLPIVAVLFVALLLFSGCFAPTDTFQKKAGAQVCTIEGKPVIRLYSASFCPHCNWVKDTYDSIVKEYVDQNKIVAYHWQVDLKDDLLTPAVEGSIPESEAAIFQQFNPEQTIPTFVFGCEYYRIGTGYEKVAGVGDLNMEAKEFRKIIDELILEAQSK